MLAGTMPGSEASQAASALPALASAAYPDWRLLRWGEWDGHDSAAAQCR